MLRSCATRAIIAILTGYTDLVREEDSELADTVLGKPVTVATLTTLVQHVREIEERRAALRSLGHL